MERRQFIAASIATSAIGIVPVLGDAQAAPQAEFYQIRRYSLQQGSQTAATSNYLGQALIPALNRMGMGPVGAFTVDIGPETPTFYVVIPGPSLELLAELDLKLGEDADFVKAADPFWNALSKSPPFQRVEISLLKAFAGWPKLTPPPSSATKSSRIFQLRTYESPSNGAHVRKVEMMHAGEFDIFVKAGCQPVFFGRTLSGSRMPNLTYMLSFANSQELDARWQVFLNDPAWKKLTTDPRYSYDHIVTNINNLVLRPLPVSQI